MSRAIEAVLTMAAEYAALREDRRSYLLGAVGLRADGRIVHSCNGSTPLPDRTQHAEYRLSRKLDKGSEVYVSRVLKDGWITMARPCAACLKALGSKGVSRVYYTIDMNEYGVIKL